MEIILEQKNGITLGLGSKPISVGVAVAEAPNDGNVYARKNKKWLGINNTLNVTITQTSSVNKAYIFTKVNFDAVSANAIVGLPISVKITDNRSATFKTINLSGIYPAKWNSTLSQIEIPDPNIARGFYINGTTPANRGCVTFNTSRYLSLSSLFSFDQTTGYYKYEELANISETTMESIYKDSTSIFNVQYMDELYAYSTNPVIFIKRNIGGGVTSNISANAMFYLCNATYITFSRLYALSYFSTFRNCANLRKISGDIRILGASKDSVANMFTGCPNLESVSVFNLAASISFADCPKLHRDSILYMINNSSNGATVITITLHATAAERLTAEDYTLASSRNITIAIA